MTDFEDIRPFHDDEVAYELRKLVNDDGFVDFLASWLTPPLSRYAPSLVRSLLKLYLSRLIRPIKDIDAFQSLIARFANKLIREGTDDVKYEGFEKLEPNKSYLFISNHRDIACDSMFLDYGLYINGRLHKNPMRVERIAKSLLLDLKDANYAMSCACVFWEWVNRIVFTHCTDTVLQQCKDRILSKEKKRWTDGAIMAGRGSVSDGGQGTRTLRISFVLNRAIQYIEEHLGHDVHYC